ncbi:Do family serine endopeptidase [Alloacidobacterium dinghuense]|uniref:Do family serine endopeptidase n=1 Tax=Alloacidobacterium dinghuense TaxID=2763107 RepID=A0A7G8BP02_9BACT|nr:Do family serine endopeptidase [Alloacidobacterium dinghuense]QNI34272.1 Do family serine endopeptidase [Alloacidobacterium dinghuense]
MDVGKVKSLLTRRVVIPAIVGGAALSLGAYTIMKPGSAVMAAPGYTAAAGPLDNNSVSALLSLDQAMETLAARVTPAVVNVTVTSKVNSPHQVSEGDDDGQDGQQMPPMLGPSSPFGQFFRGQPQQGPTIEHGLGSGVIISPDGYIVTNNHVIDGAIDINVTMSNREVYKAKLIGADPLTDLAIIKIDGKNLPSIPWGDSSQLHPGQMVLAFGNPLGFRFTVTRGIISALNRSNPYGTDRHKPGQFIQTDAAINQGNSGGALVNARGELIGINTFIISQSGGFAGMGFAIPQAIVQHTAETLIRDGQVHHGFMGVTIADVTPDNAKFFQMNKAVGAVVSDVSPDSPGGKAGLKTGDVITALNGKEVSDAGELQMEVSQKQAGDTIHLEVARDGKTLNVPVTLEPLGGSKGDHEVAQNGNGKGRWGLSLANITPDVRNQIQLPENVHGAVVQDVRSGSPADDAQLQPGDVIVSVNRKPISSASDAADAFKGVPSGQDALVLVWSNGGNSFRVLHPSNG